MSFGEQILSRRKELGLTQQNVANELHITRQTLSKWENNKSYPDLKLLLALSALPQSERLENNFPSKWYEETSWSSHSNIG